MIKHYRNRINSLTESLDRLAAAAHAADVRQIYLAAREHMALAERLLADSRKALLGNSEKP